MVTANVQDARKKYCAGGVCPLCEVLDLDPENAHGTRWAKKWKLAPRHARIAAFMMQGFQDKEIATSTGLTVGTVRTYVKRILKAADARNRPGLMKRALLVTLPDE